MRKILYTILFSAGLNGAFAQETATMKIGDTSKLVISKYIYGQFAEHLGRCIYDGFTCNGKIRMDVVDAMREIQVPLLRWPGGCFADNYHWQDGIGPKSKRAAIVNTQWGMVTDDSSFGTDEFMKLCKLIGCDPYVAGNVGTGTPQEMESWVEYLNYDGPSSMAKLRAKNGHAAPYHVPFFGVGNESWGCGGRMTPEDYASKYRTFANFVKDYPGSDIQRMVSGANGADYHWTEVMMSHIPLWLMQGIGVHYYTLVDNQWGHGSATDFDEDSYFRALRSALFMQELIDKHSAIMDKYDPDKNIFLAIDEWGISLKPEPGTNPDFLYQQNSLRDALIAATTLNIFNNHCARVRMANLAQAVNVLQALVLTQGDKMLKTPTWYVFDLYKHHQNAKWLPVHLQTPDYHFKDQAIPAVNGSASQDSSGTVHITLVNLDAHQSIKVSTSLKKKGTLSGQLLTSQHFNDVNTFEQPEKVKTVAYTNALLSNGVLNADLPPMSVVELTIKP
jgi:alpha-N-arabinofuranosidase